ncbi:hypothetical protein K6119_08065 [Paracrocinitomix mangrovi]|uniref:hypothetical protein n=1 Tax=Paracrocinitomix mangrovi TaxID=2862509 RepID=UPI001C8EB8F2|nr:hypothetical protein [Paracrocinitomix mangrovi]UKN03467.1 hypothetical protein K6119_08065 [Paracrocinitomix mangrovi]
MGIYKFYLILIFLIVSKSYAQEIRLEIYNSTKFDLSNVQLGGESIKLLKSGKTKTLIVKTAIDWQDGAPFGNVVAQVKKHGEKRYWKLDCGTGLHSISSGTYCVSIVMSPTENKEGYYLFWRRNTGVKNCP